MQYSNGFDKKAFGRQIMTCFKSQGFNPYNPPDNVPYTAAAIYKVFHGKSSWDLMFDIAKAIGLKVEMTLYEGSEKIYSQCG